MLKLGILTFVVSFALACSGGAKPTANAAAGQTFNSTGVIKAVDPAAGKVTIDHKDIPGLMNAMTMTWAVVDPATLAGITAGDNVAFEVIKNGAEIKFTRITKIVEAAAVDGKQIFASNCTLCHGVSGEGTKRGIPLTSGHALDHTAEEYVAQVSNGTTGKMPAFSGKLSDEQIAAVVDHLRNVIQAGIDRSTATGHHH